MQMLHLFLAVTILTVSAHLVAKVVYLPLFATINDIVQSESTQ
jgi:hypothetical protein